jgi:hypothetical protein
MFSSARSNLPSRSSPLRLRSGQGSELLVLILTEMKKEMKKEMKMKIV